MIPIHTDIDILHIDSAILHPRILLPCILVLELCFYIYYKLMVQHVQKRQIPPSTTKAERLELFARIVKYLNAEKYAKIFLSRWCGGAEFNQIKRNNSTDFLSWAMFGLYPHELNIEETKERDDLLYALEAKVVDKPIPEGHNSNVNSFRLNLDPINVTHRPMLWYIILNCLVQINSLLLYLSGYRKYKRGALTYWYRSSRNYPSILESFFQSIKIILCHYSTLFRPCCTSKHDAIPIVFIHGIGIGLLPYQFFLHMLTSTRRRPMILIQLPFISMQLQDRIPSIKETTESIQMILSKHDIDQASFVGHSFGTVIIAQLLKSHPKLLKNVVLIDAVCFLLFLPDVCTNFVYCNGPIKDGSLYCQIKRKIIRYFASHELSIASTLARHFWWYKNICFPDQLPENSAILLGGQDEIIPAERVEKHLTEESKYRELQKKPPLDIMMEKEGGHGDFLLNWKVQCQLISMLNSDKYSN